MIHPGEGNQPPSPGHPQGNEPPWETRRESWHQGTASAVS